jgi:hypothetical protein
VWWPGASKEMERFIKACPVCQKKTLLPSAPLLPSSLPSYPWEKVASDLFELKGVTYLLVINYYSRHVVIQKLTSTTSASVITSLKAIFACHGVPMTLMTNNGPQYFSREMKEFAASYGFSHIISSPHYPSPMHRQRGA